MDAIPPSLSALSSVITRLLDNDPAAQMATRDSFAWLSWVSSSVDVCPVVRCVVCPGLPDDVAGRDAVLHRQDYDSAGLVRGLVSLACHVASAVAAGIGHTDCVGVGVCGFVSGFHLPHNAPVDAYHAMWFSMWLQVEGRRGHAWHDQPCWIPGCWIRCELRGGAPTSSTSSFWRSSLRRRHSQEDTVVSEASPMRATHSCLRREKHAPNEAIT